MKRLLVLRACGIEGEKEECDIICKQAKLYGFDVMDFCPKDNFELLNILQSNGSFDYIYLSSHGDAEGFGNESSSVSFRWTDFGLNLCDSKCMNVDCVIMLSCCRGGLHQVAYNLFLCCNQISYIVGPRQSLPPHEMIISFNVLLFNLECRNIDPILACEKIKNATDIRFICFDRLETEGEIGYQLYVNDMNREFMESLNKVKEKVNEPLIEIPEKR